MDTERSFKIARCPMCGGVNLEAGYDPNFDAASKAEIGTGSLFGIIKGKLFGKGASGKYWRCLQCGHAFLME